MELEGNLSIERAPTRRWVSIVAVIVPVIAFVGLAAWFIRAYVAPPTIAIPNPMVLAAAPSAPPSPARVEAQAPAPEPPQPAAAEPAASAPTAETTAPPPTNLPMFATLAAAPPTLDNAPVAFADPAQDRSSAMPAEPSALEASEPIAGPVPVPRPKPRVSVAVVTGPVPLPRPRPATEDPPPPDLPAFDRHSVE